MDYGILTEPQFGGTFADQVRLARWCEANDIAVFGRSDHYLFLGRSHHATDAFASLAGLAVATSTVTLAAMVSPISFRHPAVIAKMAATIDEMSGGRLLLGVGTGWMQEEHDAFGMELWPMRERFARLEEALQFLRAAFTPGAQGFTGRYYTLADVEVLPVPRGVEIMVGGGGDRKTPTLAGRYADEYNQFVDGHEALAARFEVFRAAAREAGRDPDSIRVSVVSQAIMGDDAAGYRERLAAEASLRSITVDVYEQRLERRAVLRGTPEQVRDQAAALAALGISRIYIQDVDPLGEIDTARLERAFAAVRG